MTTAKKPLLEICVESFDDAMVAARAGADRIEYCAALAVGGVTPSAGAMARLRDIPVPCRVMIRPRPGDFIYGASDVAMMKHDIALARDHGAEGIVIGAATPDGRLDRDMLADLLSVAGGLGATLHRVFDAVPDPFDALEGAIDLGFDRILTSGQQPTAEQGADMIARLITQADGRITVLPGSGITPENAAKLLRTTGAVELHASCKKANPAGGGYAAGRVETDGGIVRVLKAGMAAPPALS
ncbi:copper homeostasis protein CutC [Thalassospira xiamenensis]|uniref:PF03932 family protein CutC n=1 Tax=Thalassospira xiamenensis TaxID=220697 RepID=A0ABR5Y4H6_9PROT|nr:copper homeostasis protein CutC [Thalassospira xiamenensis]KZD05428.1 copper homeostasis protein CutC [Thalassospira xiamenensis]KZD11488.1 copper homeostasis protein CutC [Thalassospira xiamenensis]MCD1593011.1 copper homeostasis protein CutC [Thalassospira xiamenensis]